MYMLKINIIFLILIIFFSKISLSFGEDKYLSLKKSKVNVRYGPSFDFLSNIFIKKRICQ